MQILIFGKKSYWTKGGFWFSEKKKLLNKRRILIFGKKKVIEQKADFDFRKKKLLNKRRILIFGKKSYWTKGGFWFSEKKLLNKRRILIFGKKVTEQKADFDFRKKKLLNKRRILIFSTTFACNISHSTNSARHSKCRSTHVCMQRTRYSGQILMKPEFSWHQQIWNFMKIRPAGAEEFHADGRTNRYNEDKVSYCNFTSAPKKFYFIYAPQK